MGYCGEGWGDRAEGTGGGATPMRDGDRTRKKKNADQWAAGGRLSVGGNDDPSTRFGNCFGGLTFRVGNNAL